MKPNIILLISDALRAMNLKFYGYKEDTTPYLSRLYNKGELQFIENFYSTTDQTDPSFTTILSGRYPLTHGILRHGPDVRKEDIITFNKTKTRLLSELLVKNGYQTIAIDFLGRWHKRGFKIYGEPDEIHNTKTTISKIIRHKIIKKVLKGTYIYAPYESLAIRISQFYPKHNIYFKLDGISYMIGAIKILDQVIKEKKPFFLMIHFWDTHTPFTNVPRSLWKKYFKKGINRTPMNEMLRKIKNDKWREIVKNYHLRRIKYVEEIEPKYNGEINYVDYAIKMLIEYLEDRKIYEETVIFLTGDHGDNLVRDGIFVGHGGLYQRVIKVPLIIINSPFNKDIRKKHSQHIDLVPTIIELTGIEIKNYYLDGESLTKVNSKKTIFAVSSVARKRYAVLSDDLRYKLIYSPTIDDGMDKYGGLWMKDRIELYDLTKDPDEKINVANEYPDIVKELEAKINTIVTRLNRIRMKLSITLHK
ncbi:MAG: hypothetical protein B6U89_00785 [Desulfurococcales archaeon ex4484_58]|nr:MAG: hypothetical protein B6U89_00785 [Desulfurococcales archaeon ex4484_58]